MILGANNSRRNRQKRVSKPGSAIQLTSQTGVRCSIDNPDVCIENNRVGAFNLLGARRTYAV
jgi:dTDP-D-glucose 4,6-dehydratase